ncbi:6-phospho-3-hexuloisomerase [Deinococcus metalli]|uniref:6-phospho-3-hexuloisomerase n=1 Tax=Deinococcus metalli TaxID=1141878 RepID=A0A7W8NPI0_9DEIO|nr:SIS domain-containing protein [Deinococcus metalli]MBB5376806.1 6-phospho-3-hexuloisomerase [Deinococcus metalli]GHF45484.1 hexulose-6-phosphate isomerase [Deinococcus metalli]
MPQSSDLNVLAHHALSEVGQVLAALDPSAPDRFVEEVTRAGRVAVYGVGREGLTMRALAMRLYHAGVHASVVGDMSAPPLGAGDLLIASAGPGGFSTVNALLGVARAAGARTLLFTAQPGGPAAALADTVVVVPARTMADDHDGAPPTPGSLPMGSVYELSVWLLGDLLIEALVARTGRRPEELSARHTNLE